MPEAYKFRAFWRARPESAATCAARLAHMLSLLAPIHPAFSQWYEAVEDDEAEEAIAQGRDLADTVKVPFCSMPPRVAELTAIVESNVAMKDMPHVPWPELGYSISFWNALPEPNDAAVLMTVGATRRSGESANSIDFGLPEPGAGNADLVSAKTFRRFVLAIVDAWAPDWGSLGPRDFVPPSRTADHPFARPWGGWMTYLAQPWAGKVTPPITVESEETADGGLLMLATDEVFRLANPSHVARADAIDAAMAPIRWGLVYPKPPG